MLGNAYKIRLIWVKAHIGMRPNDRVDKLVRYLEFSGKHNEEVVTKYFVKKKYKTIGNNYSRKTIFLDPLNTFKCIHFYLLPLGIWLDVRHFFRLKMSDLPNFVCEEVGLGMYSVEERDERFT